MNSVIRKNSPHSCYPISLSRRKQRLEANYRIGDYFRLSALQKIVLKLYFGEFLW
jgi:hypothetical protein